jgi:magnesium chelatase family protein
MVAHRLGLLAPSAQAPTVALEGGVRPVQGVLPAALAARAAGHTLIVPAVNAEEACLTSGLKVIA